MRVPCWRQTIVGSLLVLGMQAHAEPVVEGAEITLFGTFLYDEEPDGSFLVRHQNTTTEIRGELGSEFGYYYQISGQPAGGEVDVTIVIRLPAQGKMRRTPSRARIGDKHYAGYVMDAPSEILPMGPVVQEVWHQDRLLVAKTFRIVPGGKHRCPPFPEGICVPGGIALRPLDSSGGAKAFPILYKLDKTDLRDALSKAARDSDWSIDDWREGHEPEGVRFRTTISRGKESVGVSIYSTPEGSILQLTVFPYEDA